MLTNPGTRNPQDLALEIYKEMWSYYNIINNLVVVPNQDECQRNELGNAMNEPTVDLHTGFPYEQGNSGEVKEVVLLDQFRWDKYPTPGQEVNFFPTKTPKNYQDCPFKVASIGIDPFINLPDNSTQKENRPLEVGGLSIGDLLPSIQKMNWTPIFLQPV
ncbi:hypothetical protein ANN_19798 [Periplaneta americana]|uniref:Uncharacterized protein n=1 Tax=Periplaneta americana TaxID=6978 RepID=A0ABQ8SAV3_PERAM|nr:hypothetical protein ANN_19798 [Periplaneta americana]